MKSMSFRFSYLMNNRLRTLIAGGLAVTSLAGRATAAEPRPVSVVELKKLSVEELATLKVTSVGKKAEKLSTAAAAVHVITQEDLRRTGSDSIAEALRLAPGLQVGQIDSHNWAISSRGFNGLFANKLLVLMDGRSVYTPLFAGVFWDVQDTMLEDLDRIEVIRGPGASLWGGERCEWRDQHHQQAGEGNAGNVAFRWRILDSTGVRRSPLWRAGQ